LVPIPPSFLDVASGVGGPFALTGVALAYLGWVSAQAQARAVGIDVEVLGWQEREDALMAVARLIGPLLVLATAGVVLAVADHWSPTHLRGPGLRFLSWMAQTLALVSSGLAVLGYRDTVDFTPA
jgi:hypothetical protein